jgi:hypothetical protein
MAKPWSPQQSPVIASVCWMKFFGTLQLMWRKGQDTQDQNPVDQSFK